MIISEIQSPDIRDIQRSLKKLADPVKAKFLSGYFKTGPGHYGAGDRFLGIVVPAQRQVAKKFIHLGLDDLQELLNSPWHEFRLTALLILVDKYERAAAAEQAEIVKFYRRNFRRINNWDLVDLSAPKILGKYYYGRGRRWLYQAAKSRNLWERRIAVLTTFEFIRQGDFSDSLKLAEYLLKDDHDLMHKAVGWMLREIGKRDRRVLEKFLKKHHQEMSRTMLRYAIEKFPEKERRKYLIKTK